ncbi:MAG: hypothetical protein JWN00_3891 [Actinomycetia bacterium]|jgi:hypothetical protein|nr:hypothetical protein [Actinomycetes bacterium]
MRSARRSRWVWAAPGALATACAVVVAAFAGAGSPACAAVVTTTGQATYYRAASGSGRADVRHGRRPPTARSDSEPGRRAAQPVSRSNPTGGGVRTPVQHPQAMLNRSPAGDQTGRT